MTLKSRFTGCSGRLECTRKQKHHPNTWPQYSVSIAWSIDRGLSSISYMDNPDRLQTHDCIKQLRIYTAFVGQIECSKLFSSALRLPQACQPYSISSKNSSRVSLTTEFTV